MKSSEQKITEKMRVADSSKINIVNQYNEAVEAFKNNATQINGNEYVKLDTALETLQDILPFSSMFK
ncbi:hypothetical protein [Clostridium ihumii]|uniref:hypothetical protein n=1 Tax=Clostridium ihumii TaxID=1470356 RepID=UPI00058EEEC8|nr:hypothetical protein [Clostridium ihumii]